MRALTPLILSASLVVGLAACAPAATENASGCTPVASGSSSSGVTADGAFGSKPQVSIPSPTSADATQRSVLIEGDGDTVVAGDIVEIEFTLFNGQNGQELSATEYAGRPTEFPVDDAQLLPGIVRTLECSTVGSRVVGVIPAIDAFGDTGSEQLGVKAGENIVFVVDILGIVPPPEPALPRADGEDQEPTPGFPTVVLDENGRPTITLPDEAPPTDLKIAVLKKGSGAVVEDGDDVTVHYVGLNWNTGVIFDESWGRGAPATFNTTQVIEGFTAALVGQTVGSQVIVIIPPDYGYGPAGAGTDIGGTDTIVFVVDILGID